MAILCGILSRPCGGKPRRGVTGGGWCRHFVSLLWPSRAGRQVFSSQSVCLGWSLGGTLLRGLKHQVRVENARFPWPRLPQLPAPRSGPLCRSAASGHSRRARALRAPPPSRRGYPFPASCRFSFLSRDPSRKTWRRASGVSLVPLWSFAKGRDRSIPASVATRLGAEARYLGRAPA